MMSRPPRAGGLQVCTIIARNYLPAARVLASSFLAHNPGGRIAVLVIDDVLGVIDADREPFEVLRPEDLFSDLAELHRMATIYEITEFATSMKPWLLEHLLDRGEKSVLYLDPDIGVFDRLDELAEVAQRTGIALIPHARSPFPRDEKMTSESANPGGRGLQPRIHRGRAGVQIVPRLLERTSRARVPQRSTEHEVRRPTLGRFRAGHVRLWHRP